LNRGDVEAVLACVSPDFVNEHTAVGGRNRIGRAAYAEALPGFLADFEGLHYEVEDVIGEGERIAVPYAMSFRHVPSGRAPVRVRGIFVFTRGDDGLIGRRVDYWDSGQVQSQISEFLASEGVSGDSGS
jgi:ketosteroid isomerase-like protein